MFFFFVPSGQTAASDDREPGRLYLRDYRQLAGLKLREIAERVEVHVSAVQKWETGVAYPSLPHLFRLGRLYGVHVGALFMDPSTINYDDNGEMYFRVAASAPAPQESEEAIHNSTTRQKLSHQLARCFKIASRMPDEWTENWLRVGELLDVTSSHSAPTSSSAAMKQPMLVEGVQNGEKK